MNFTSLSQNEHTIVVTIDLQCMHPTHNSLIINWIGTSKCHPITVTKATYKNVAHIYLIQWCYFVNIFACVHVCECVHVCGCVRVHVCVCMHVCACLHVYMCVCVCELCVCMHVHV